MRLELAHDGLASSSSTSVCTARTSPALHAASSSALLMWLTCLGYSRHLTCCGNEQSAGGVSVTLQQRIFSAKTFACSQWLRKHNVGAGVHTQYAALPTHTHALTRAPKHKQRSKCDSNNPQANTTYVVHKHRPTPLFCTYICLCLCRRFWGRMSSLCALHPTFRDPYAALHRMVAVKRLPWGPVGTCGPHPPPAGC